MLILETAFKYKLAMADTLVIQSHRLPLAQQWMQVCMESVHAWADKNSYDYQFFGDEIFDLLDQKIIDKTLKQKIIATDLARLKLLQQALAKNYRTVIWCDADFLIFDADHFIVANSDFALGREVWVQQDAQLKLRVYRKVHNAFLMFRRGNSFLDFYCDTAERLLNLNQGSMSPQFIGPKLLTALHNVAICPVMEAAGMLSPLVIRDAIEGTGPALDLLREKSKTLPSGANLSASLVASEGLDNSQMFRLIDQLIAGVI